MNFRNEYSIFDSQLEQINTIIRSTSELVSILKKGDKLNDTLKNTISEIFNFLFKVLNLLPEILLSKEEHSLYKSQLIESFADLQLAWEVYEEMPGEFAERWSDFVYLWDNFYDQFQRINSSSKTIYLSLN